MDIRSGAGYPASALSNFAPRQFVFDGVECNSAEGLLQAFKSRYEHVQVEICKLVGFKAKKRGSEINWKKDQILYWKGVEYKRDSEEYQELLDRAYDAMLEQSESFRKALLATGDAVLKHSIGKRDAAETVLTEREYCSRLTRCRAKIS